MIPTISRPSLVHALRSVRKQVIVPGDEVILIGDGPQPVARELFPQFKLPGYFTEVPGPNADWGHTPRNQMMPRAAADYILALDDDDVLLPGALNMIRAALAEHPGRPHLFRGDFSKVGLGVLWKERSVAQANVSTCLFVLPTGPKLWASYTPRYGGDFDFIRDTLKLWPDGSLVWRQEIICEVRPAVKL